MPGVVSRGRWTVEDDGVAVEIDGTLLYDADTERSTPTIVMRWSAEDEEQVAGFDGLAGLSMHRPLRTWMPAWWGRRMPTCRKAAIVSRSCRSAASAAPLGDL
jgi:hypothetical protein